MAQGESELRRVVKPEDLRALARKAQHMPAAAAAFKQKRLNLWVNTSTPWLSLDGWRKGQTRWAPEELRGEPCWIGIDLSSKIDLTAVAAVFPPTATRAALAPGGLVPHAGGHARRPRAPRPRAVSACGAARLPADQPRLAIDQDVVRAMVAEAARAFDVQHIGIDPWNAGNLLKDLAEDGLEASRSRRTSRR